MQYKYGTCGIEFLRMYYQYTVTPWKTNIKILIHTNTNMIYNIVPLEVIVWSFRMSAMYMYFALYSAKMTHIDNLSIPILRQSHYWYKRPYTLRMPRWTILCTWNGNNHIFKGYGTSLKKAVWKRYTVWIRCMWYGIPTYVIPVHHHTTENKRKNVDTHQY